MCKFLNFCISHTSTKSEDFDWIDLAWKDSGHKFGMFNSYVTSNGSWHISAMARSRAVLKKAMTSLFIHWLHPKYITLVNLLKSRSDLYQTHSEDKTKMVYKWLWVGFLDAQLKTCRLEECFVLRVVLLINWMQWFQY